MVHRPNCPSLADHNATCICREAPIVSLEERRKRAAKVIAEEPEDATLKCEACGHDEWGCVDWDFDEDNVCVIDDDERPIMVVADPEGHEALLMSADDALQLAQKLISAVKIAKGIEDDDGPKAV